MASCAIRCLSCLASSTSPEICGKNDPSAQILEPVLLSRSREDAVLATTLSWNDENGTFAAAPSAPSFPMCTRSPPCLVAVAVWMVGILVGIVVAVSRHIAWTRFFIIFVHFWDLHLRWRKTRNVSLRVSAKRQNVSTSCCPQNGFGTQRRGLSCLKRFETRLWQS